MLNFLPATKKIIHWAMISRSFSVFLLLFFSAVPFDSEGALVLVSVNKTNNKFKIANHHS